MAKKDKNIIEDNNNEEQVDDRTTSEKVEDFIEDVQDTVLGPGDNFDEDIPAVIKTDSGRRKVVKWKTNANLQKKIFGKKGFVVLMIILGVGAICSLFVYLVGLIIGA